MLNLSPEQENPKFDAVYKEVERKINDLNQRVRLLQHRFNLKPDQDNLAAREVMIELRDILLRVKKYDLGVITPAHKEEIKELCTKKLATVSKHRDTGVIKDIREFFEKWLGIKIKTNSEKIFDTVKNLIKKSP